MGSLHELIRRGVRSSCDHEVVLRCPPSGRQGNRVVSIGEYGVEVGDYLLGGSTDHQGNISTRCHIMAQVSDNVYVKAHATIS